MNEWLRVRGSCARDGWESVVDASIPGWAYTALRVANLSASDRYELPAAECERIIVPLSGSFRVEWIDASGRPGDVRLAGRASVFDGPSDVLFVGAATGASLSGTGRVAVAEAPATARYPVRHLAKAEVPVELRGSGRSSRQVHNFGVPGVLEAERLIVCEVITPAENWSSYPAHKHDENIPGHESQLEEIYYFEAAVSRGLGVVPYARPFGLFASYSSAGHEIDTTAIVRSGDIALVPHGYHGPAVAAPGYDLYYLNVMAGPGAERAWRISDDPAQAWVREGWAEQEFDSRLPYDTSGITQEGRN